MADCQYEGLNRGCWGLVLLVGERRIQGSYACPCAEDKEAKQELDEDAHDDCVPIDLRPIPRCRPEDPYKDSQAKQADGTVCSGVAGRLLGGKSSHKDDC